MPPLTGLDILWDWLSTKISRLRRWTSALEDFCYADSIYLSKQVWKTSRGHGLDAVLERLKIDTAKYRRHDARGDVGILAEAVVKMWNQITPDYSSLPAPIFSGVLPA